MARKRKTHAYSVEFLLTYEGDDSETEPDFRHEEVRATDPDAACADIWNRHVGGMGKDGQECIDVTVVRCVPANGK